MNDPDDSPVTGEGGAATPMDLSDMLTTSRKRARGSDGNLSEQECSGETKTSEKRRKVVSPTIQVAAPKIVLVAKTHQVPPHRLRVSLGTSAPFDGTGRLDATNAGNIRVYTAAAGGLAVNLPMSNLQGATLSQGINLYVEGALASAAVGGVTFTLALMGGTVDVGPPASDDLTCIELTLDICACRDHVANDPAPLSAANKINPGRNLHLQRASFCAGRARLIVRQAQPATYNGNLTLVPIDNRVQLFDQESAAGAQAATGTPATLANSGLGAGQVYWVEGVAASGALRDSGFRLELQDLPNQEGDRVAVTVVDVGLDICASRTAPAVDPNALTANAKLDPGRYVQLRNAGNHHGRAKLIVRQPVPAAFAGNLVLHALDNRVEAFLAEIPTGGQAVSVTSAAPWTIGANTIPAQGQVLWAEGANVSGGLRDTGFRLKLADATDGEHVANDGDQVKMTVVTFTQIQATIRPTPSITPNNSVLGGFPPPLDHVFVNNDLDEDFTANPPLVLMRNAQPDIELVVTASPANLPLRWQAIRNSLDHASLGGAAAVPTVTPDGGNASRCNLAADNKGSFRIRSYIDCNGSNDYSEREPSIPLNLVLADATLVADNSIARPGNLVAQGVAGGVVIKNGAWNANLPGAGMAMEVVADVTGGGSDGRLGLDKVFAGLVNVLARGQIRAVYRDPLTGGMYTVDNIYVANSGDATGGYSGKVMFRPAGQPPPRIYAFPLLDSGRPDPGTGGEKATMKRSGAFDPPRADLTVGSRCTIRCIDSPARGFLRIHPDHPNALLREIYYDQQFVANFCFWTNVNRSRAPSGHAAERVYCVLRIVPWGITGDWLVNSVNQSPVLSPAVPPNPHTIQTGASTTLHPIARAQDHNVEVRPPSGIQQSAWRTT